MLNAELRITKCKSVHYFKSRTYQVNYAVSLAGYFRNGKQGINAGDVTCAGYKLPFYTRPLQYGGLSEYSYDTIAFSSDFDGLKSWVVSGNSESHMPPFSITSTGTFSSISELIYPTVPVVTRSLPFTINWNNSIGCDSIEISLSDHKNKSLRDCFPGNVSSHTFSSAQLAALDSTTDNGADGINEGDLMIIARKFRAETISGVNVLVENDVEILMGLKIK